MTDLALDGERESSVVALYPLTFVEEGSQVVIGRPEIDSFAVFPADAAAVVRHLEAGEDLDSVAAWYQQTYGEPADLGDFVETLRDLDFIRPGSRGDTPPAVAGPVRWRRLAAVLLSAPALCLYALAAGAAVYLMWRVPGVRPSPSAVFFSRYLLVITFAVFAAQLGGIALHEGFHVLAGRRLGLPTSLSIGRRLYFVVFQTTLAGLLGVPARKRILPFCAGLIADAVLVSVLTGLAEIARTAGWPPWTGRVALGLAYATLLRMLWQVMIFMETDLYHVLASVLRCPDLYQMTRIYLRNRWARLRRQRAGTAEESSWSARDLRIVRWYAPFVVVGSVAMIGIAAVAAIPILAGLATRAFHGIADGSAGTAQFWDSAFAGMLFVSQFAVVGALALRERGRRRAAVRAGA
jgi:hypothetical protein